MQVSTHKMPVQFGSEAGQPSAPLGAAMFTAAPSYRPGTLRPTMKDLFLCHTGADKDWTRHLGARLEAEHVQGRPIEVFFDEWDIDYGENILTKIDQGLRQSRYVGLVLSPRMVQAEWPTAEWQSQVMADPTGKRGKILPILRYKFDPESGEPIDLPFVLAPLKRFDFTRDQTFEAEFARLVRRLSDLPPARGPRRGGLGAALGAPPVGQEAPDAVDEALPSNLFPVLRLPEVLYSDATPARRKSEVWAVLKGKRVSPFTLHGERLISFVPPGPANPFRTFLSGTAPRSERVSDWLADPDLSRQLLGMLNAGLREHCYHLGIFTSKKDRAQFYCPIFADGDGREFRWGTVNASGAGGGSTGRSRALAKLKTRPDGTQFGVHMSAAMRFIALGDRLFLLIEPGWFFTTDGITPLEGAEVGRYSTLWGGKERNAAVLRNVLMWGLLVAEGRREIAVNLGTAEAPVVVYVQSVPAHTKLSAGRVGDAIRLDRILGGEGAGEVRRGGAAPGGTGGQTYDADEELDVVADLALIGALAADDESEREREVDDEVDGDGDDAVSSAAAFESTNGGSAVGYDHAAEAAVARPIRNSPPADELELPF